MGVEEVVQTGRGRNRGDSAAKWPEYAARHLPTIGIILLIVFLVGDPGTDGDERDHATVGVSAGLQRCAWNGVSGLLASLPAHIR